jgi:hypothetical protein
VRADGAVPRQTDLEAGAVVASVDRQRSAQSGDPLLEHDGTEVARDQFGVLEMSPEGEALAVVSDRDPDPVTVEAQAHPHERDRGRSPGASLPRV